MDKPLSKRSSAINCHCFLCISAAFLAFCFVHLCIADEAAVNNEQPQNEPVVCILSVPEAKSAKPNNASNHESLTIYKLFDLLPSDKYLKINTGYEYLENKDFKSCNIGVYLYKREVASDNNDRLLLKFDIECNGKLFPIPELSWNQKDDVLLWSGGNCIVFLSTNNKFHYSIVKKTK